MSECVYIYYHPKHKYVYVGRTNNLKRRLYEHDHSDVTNSELFRSCRVYYAEFANKAETIAVEAFLINDKKPLLNHSAKYVGKTKGLFMILPEFKYYRDRHEQTANDIIDNDDLGLQHQYEVIDVEQARRADKYALFEASLEIANLRGLLHASKRKYDELVEWHNNSTMGLYRLNTSILDCNEKLFEFIAQKGWK